MNERPLLMFPSKTLASRTNKGGGPSDLHFPMGTQQVERMGSKFRELEDAFDSQRMEIRPSPMGMEPERVLVFETLGRIDDFYVALKGINGMEWLGDSDEMVLGDESFYGKDSSDVEDLPGRVYLVMSNQQGLAQLQSLWRTFAQNPEDPQFRKGWTKWRDLFRQLRDIRQWGAEDRVRDTGLRDDWQQRIELGQDTVRIEVELWYRSSQSSRLLAETIVRQAVDSLGGNVLSSTLINEIGYHAMLARLPISAVGDMVNLGDVQIVRCDQVMFFRPLGQALVSTPKDDEVITTLDVAPQPTTSGSPVAGLLDGLPLESHRLLEQRLIVDDPDGWGASLEARDRLHGTSMASIIIHGELDEGAEPISTPLYVRPILKPDPRDWSSEKGEYIPEDELPVDLVHRAVRRMFEPTGGVAPAAPTVKIVNLSVCDMSRPFDRTMSPLARLVDYLSWRYHILFVISAGNCAGDIVLPHLRTQFDELRRDPVLLEQQTLRGLTADTRNRRLLSPAESINALTVGSTHQDCSLGVPRGDLVDPYVSGGLPSPYSPHGFGFRRSVKPDVLLPGGRQLFREKLGTSHSSARLQAVKTNSSPGQRVATPGTRPGEVAATSYTRGTSNSAALATRAAITIHGALSRLAGEVGGDRLVGDCCAVATKALLVHSSRWGCVPVLRDRLGYPDVNALARLLGYGQVELDRALACTGQRATLTGCDELVDGDAHCYQLPLPPSLSGYRDWRRLTVTLAWMTPINAAHRNYRVADLWVTPYGSGTTDGSAVASLRVKRQNVDWQAARRGTVQHEILEGASATSYIDGTVIKLQVNCRSDAGVLYDRVPYALVVSLEVAPESGIDIYNEVRARVRPTVMVGIHPQAR